MQNWFSIKTGFASSIEATKLDLSPNGSIQNLFIIKYYDWLCVYNYIYFLIYICLFFIYIYKENICIYRLICTQSILVFDTMQVFYWPVLGLIQLCIFDRRSKTCLDTKPVLIPLRNWLCACSKTSFVPSLNLLHQNRLASALNLPFHFE